MVTRKADTAGVPQEDTRKKPKRRSSKTATAKSKQKKTTAKAVSKTATKKTTKKSLASQKKSTQKREAKKTNKNNPVPDAELQRNNETTTKKRVMVVEDCNPTVATVAVHNSVTLALRSAVRPIFERTTVVAYTARIAGVLFVVLGAFFTLLNTDGINNIYATMDSTAQKAETISTTCDPATEVCTDPSGSTQYPESDPTLVVDFRYPPDPFTGVVELKYVVPYATQVKATVFYKDTLEYIVLGHADQIDANTWAFPWDTRQYLDGEYRLHAVVQNEFGQYDAADGTYVTVENNPYVEATEPPADTTTTTTLDSGAGGTVSTKNTTPLSVTTVEESDPVSGGVTITISVPEATKVRVYASQEQAGGSRTALGYAEKKSSTEWRFIWYTEAYPDGTYTISPLITNSYGSYAGDAVTVSVENAPKDSTTDLTSSDTDGVHTVSTDETTETATQTDLSEPEAVTTPPVEIVITDGSVATGDTDILLHTQGASFIELYARSRYTLTKYFLGLATKRDTERWRFRWNTTQIPNGEYIVVARTKNQYGIYDTYSKPVTVQNEIQKTTTVQEDAHIEELQMTSDATRSIEDTVLRETSNEFVSHDTETTATASAVDYFVETDELSDAAETLLQDFRERLRKEIDRFARAVRNNDETEMEAVQKRIRALREEIVSSIAQTEAADLVARIDTFLEESIKKIQETVMENERIIYERIGDTVFTDSDQDGISDYDEVNVYKTDPFVADSDGDGFTDGAEILRGFNPTDSSAEAFVVHESPKEAGIVREDILTVESVVAVDLETTVPPQDEVRDEALQEPTDSEVRAPVALISGKGLPNSFVTLYIFSTPIIVTVKTDDDGSWNYTFDKELEDGEHEVYVGITDNAGRIIAKSNPFAFVKTAQAFTPVDAADTASVAPTAEDTSSFLSQHVLLLVLSIAVVSIGLVLMLLGFYLSNRSSNSVVQHE